jgi:ABC-2 type transport system ATP-binding protein
MARVSHTVEVAGLSKTFGRVVAVQDLSFAVAPGRVTGFLGPNGAGKTTTLRMLLGLVTPTAGTALIDGKRYAELPDPLRTVGAALEATGFHAGRTARNHLRVLATTAGIGIGRVDELLALVGLADAARRRVGGFSLGMRQRLALAQALLGDPGVLLLDEPANGLDPEGIVWLRGFLRHLASQGRTVLVSSHVLTEVQQSVDDVIIINHGRLISQGPLSSLEGPSVTVVRTPNPEPLLAGLGRAGFSAASTESDAGVTTMEVRGVEPARVGALAYAIGVELHELRSRASDLESVFLELTGGEPAPGGRS